MSLQTIRLCLLSRLGITLLGFISNALIPDHNADAYRHSLLSQYKPKSLSNLDHAILRFTEAFTRWDAQYFLALAHENRYLSDQMLAFFPFFPGLTRNVAFALQYLLSWAFQVKLTLLCSILLSAHLVNLFAFLLSGWFLYQLTLYMSNCKRTSRRVVQFFAFNPASIFFTAYYTESLYSCCTFGALYFLYTFQKVAVSAVLFALSVHTRSNGLISVLYLVFYESMILLVNFKSSKSSWSTLYLAITFPLRVLFYLITCAIPLILYTVTAWEEFCDPPTKASPKWCDSTFVFPYDSVQSKYWNVGFLRYYQFKQIPNFLLASPTIALVIWSTITYLAQIYPQITSFLGAFVQMKHSKAQVSQFLKPNQPEKGHKRVDLFQQPCLLPFALHSLFFAIFCLLFMHVQVATRFLFSSNPWPYWALFHLTDRRLLGSRTNLIITAWLAGYCLIGTALFANFLPFT